MIGGHGNDSLYGGDGNDIVRGGDGDDFFDGVVGDDSIEGQAGGDALLGQDGDDALDGSNQPDLLIGGPGVDELHAGNNENLLIGGSTLFDADQMALGWIMSAWKLPGTTNHNRIALLTDPDSVYYLQSGHSVMDDGEIDELFGEGDLEWLFPSGPYDSSSCDSLSDLSPNEPFDLSVLPDDLLTDQIVWPPLSLPQPEYLESFYDPIFGTRLTRITGDYGVEFTVPTNTGGSITKPWSSVVKNRYTTDSPWNIDGSLIHLRSFDPHQPYQILLNGGTLEPQLIVFLPNTNFRWSADPARPNIQYSLIKRITDSSLDDIIYEYDVTNAVITKTIDLPFNKFYSGKEVVAYVDGKQYVAIAGVDEVDPSTGIHVYIVNLDHAEGESPVVASFPLDVQPGGTMDPADWTVNTNTLTSSPDGRHVLVMYDGPTDDDVAWRLLDVDLSSGLVTPHELPVDQVGHALSSPADPALGFFPVNWGHPVFGYGADGDVYLVAGSGRWQGKDVPGVLNLGAGVGGVLSFNPRTNTYQSLTDPDDEAHVSHVTATNYDRPGWVFVSYRSDRGGEMYRGEIVALNLDAPGDPDVGMKRLGHHQSNEVGCYQCQPHLVANRDGTRLIVSSTWGPEQAVVSSYLLEFELPA